MQFRAHAAGALFLDHRPVQIAGVAGGGKEVQGQPLARARRLGSLFWPAGAWPEPQATPQTDGSRFFLMPLLATIGPEGEAKADAGTEMSGTRAVKKVATDKDGDAQA